jgi:hypothetical protein
MEHFGYLNQMFVLKMMGNGLRIREGRGTSIYFIRRYNLVLCGLD